MTHYDYHATLLHLFGLDHKRLVFRRNGAGAIAGGRQAVPCGQEIIA